MRVISVVDTPYYPLVFPGEAGDMTMFAEIEASAQQRARTAVDKAASILQETGKIRAGSVTSDVLSGSAKRAILEDADTFGADLIVVGSYGHGHFERFRLGSCPARWPSTQSAQWKSCGSLEAGREGQPRDGHNGDGPTTGSVRGWWTRRSRDAQPALRILDHLVRETTWHDPSSSNKGERHAHARIFSCRSQRRPIP